MMFLLLKNIEALNVNYFSVKNQNFYKILKLSFFILLVKDISKTSTPEKSENTHPGVFS